MVRSFCETVFELSLFNNKKKTFCKVTDDEHGGIFLGEGRIILDTRREDETWRKREERQEGSRGRD